MENKSKFAIFSNKSFKLLELANNTTKTIKIEVKKLESEAVTKKELMQFEFDLNMKLKEMELNAKKEIANGKMSLADVTGPPSSGKPQKSFESSGNDVLGGIDLSSFEPR